LYNVSPADVAGGVPLPKQIPFTQTDGYGSLPSSSKDAPMIMRVPVLLRFTPVRSDVLQVESQTCWVTDEMVGGIRSASS